MMNYQDWIRCEYRELSKSLGFRFTPPEEIEDRLKRVRTSMGKEGIEALLVIQKMDGYYLSGTTQDGLLFVPFEGKPLLMIKRELERAKMESPLEDAVTIQAARDLPSLISH